MKIDTRLIGVATIAALTLAGSAHAGQFIVNGDFTAPDVGGGWGLFSSIPGWTSNTTDAIEVGTSPIYGVPCVTPGCQNLEVNANTFGSVSQTVAGLTVGQSYTLSWLYGGRPGGGPQTLDVSFGGAPVTQDSGSFGAWTPNQFQVVATAPSETLTFTSLNVGGAPSYGNEITDVSLSAPEPAAWAMMLIGVAGVGYAARRRRTALAAA